MSALDRDQLYLVESDEDPGALIAMYASVTDRGVEWFDASRDRGFRALDVVSHDGVVEVTTPKAVYRFTPMSVELYREKVRHRVTGQPDFETTEALRRHYRALPA